MTVAAPARSTAFVQSRRMLALFAVLIVLVFALLVHISVGAKTLPLSTVVDALLHYDSNIFNHLIVHDLRLPRAVVSVLAGSALAIAGAELQAVSRNPLADPGLLGLLSGASFAAVTFIGVLGWFSTSWLPFVAALGAVSAGALVLMLARKMPGGATPVTLTLSGAAITAFLSALITLMHLFNDQAFNQMRVWLVGSLSGQSWSSVLWVLPWWLVGMALALSQGASLTVLSLGDDSAKSLGIQVERSRALVLLSVIILTAAAVAVAGPLGFVGLVIPHVIRFFMGADYRWILPFSAAVGALYLVGIDTLARILLSPKEIATGLVTALIGAPLFMWLVAKKVRG